MNVEAAFLKLLREKVVAEHELAEQVRHEAGDDTLRRAAAHNQARALWKVLGWIDGRES